MIIVIMAVLVIVGLISSILINRRRSANVARKRLDGLLKDRLIYNSNAFVGRERLKVVLRKDKLDIRKHKLSIIDRLRRLQKRNNDIKEFQQYCKNTIDIKVDTSTKDTIDYINQRGGSLDENK